MIKRVWAVAAVLVLLFAASASAQEKFGDRRVYNVMKADAVKVDDVEGHVLVWAETKGFDLQQGNVAVNHVVSDLIKGNGRTFGYGTATNPDGDLLHYAFEGRVSTEPGTDGKPVTVAQGKWTMTGGTGKWQQRSAQGVFKNVSVSQGVSVAEWEGIWEPKK